MLTAGLRRSPYDRSGFPSSTFTRVRLSRLSRYSPALVQTPGGGLGFVFTGTALAIAALAALGVGAAGGTWGGYRLRDAENLFGPSPVLTPTILPPPAAPATRAQLETPGAWTPELMTARTNQLAAQFLAGRRSASATGAPSPEGALPIGWILTGAALLAAFFVLKR